MYIAITPCGKGQAGDLCLVSEQRLNGWVVITARPAVITDTPEWEEKPCSPAGLL